MQRYTPVRSDTELKLDGTINVFEDPATFKELSLRSGHLPDVVRVDGQIEGFAVHPDGTRFSAQAGMWLTHFDASGRQTSKHRLDTHSIDSGSLSWHPDGSRLVAIALEYQTQKKGVVIISTEAELLAEWQCEEEDEYFLDMALGPEGVVALVGNRGVLLLSSELQLVARHKDSLDRIVAPIQFSPDGNWIAVGHNVGIWLFDRQGVLVRDMRDSGSAEALCWTPENQLLVWSRGARLIDPTGVEEDRRILDGSAGVSDVFCSSDGLWGRAMDAGDVSLFNFDGQLVRRHQIKVDGVLAVSLGPKDAMLAGIYKKMFFFPPTPRAIVVTRTGPIGERGKTSRKLFEEQDAALKFLTRQRKSLEKKGSALVGFRDPEALDFVVDGLTLTGPSGRTVELEYIESSRDDEDECDAPRVEAELRVHIRGWTVVKKDGSKTLIYSYTHDSYDGENEVVLEDSKVDTRIIDKMLAELGSGAGAQAVLTAVAQHTPYPDGLLPAIEAMEQ